MTEHSFHPHRAGGGNWGRRVGVGLAVLLITAVVLWQVRRAQLSSFRAQFQNDARARAALVRQQADESLLAVKSLSWFLRGNRNMDGGRFQAFAAACLP